MGLVIVLNLKLNFIKFLKNKGCSSGKHCSSIDARALEMLKTPK